MGTQVRPLSRYDLRGELGRGGTGIVYEAYDLRTESLVALKTIAAAGPENLYRLKREFRALADVQHPNLVRLGELSSEEGLFYFTMEIVHGTNFIDYVRPTSPARAGPQSMLDEGRLRAVLPQLVSALAAIHEAGHLHRDVKPSNVLITHDGRLVLLDFGLVTALRSAEGPHDDSFEGTPTFMAPEQIEASGVGPAADWYAMGIMLFLALTGRLPFDGTFNEILEAKLLAREAPSPRKLSPGVPEDLDALCSALLQLEPSLRPSLAELRVRLGMRADEPSAGGVRAVEALFVGRDRELGELRQALDDVERGRSRMVVVEGEPGVGKSALVNRFLSSVGSRAVVLQGRCYEQETVPFKGIDAILDALSEHLLALSGDETQRVIAGGIRYLAAVFPVLKRVPVVGNATTGDRPVGNASALREQAFGEFERLLRALSTRLPVVLFVDDLQWADRDSQALLQRALLGGASCLFVATMRPGTPPEALPLAARADRVALGGLSPDESRELWNALSSGNARASIAEERRSAAMREAAGHPLFLAELARSARDHELNLRTGARLLDVLWDRVQERDEVDRELLEVVAVAGAPTPDAVLARAADVPLGEVLTRLGPLRAAQLVRVARRDDERLVEPYHDRLRESIVLRLQQDQAASLDARHLAIGRALLEGAGGELLAQRVFAIVQHLNAAHGAREDAGERARLVELNLLAARQARLTTAYDRAREYARVGLELVGDAGWSTAYEVTRDLHVERMQAEFLAGDADAARACFERARTRVTSAEDRTDLHASWIELLTGEGRYRDAIDAGRAALDALEAPVPARVGTAGVLARYLATRFVQSNRRIETLLHLPLLKDPRLQGVMRLLMSLAPAAFFSDTKLLTWILLRIAGLSMRFGVSNVSSYGFGGYGLVLSAAFGNREEGAAFAQFALTLNERFQNLDLTSKLRMIAGMLVPWVRPFAEAKEHLRMGYETALKIGDTTYECYCAVVLSIASFCESTDLAAVQSDAEWARDVSVRRKERAMIGVPDAHARHAATLRGLTPSLLDLGTTDSPDAELRASLSDSATPTALFYYQFCTADLAYHFGSAATARALLREAKKRTEGIFGLPTTVELHFLDALVAAREHDLAETPWRARLALRLAVHGALRKLKAWATSCPANFEAHALIIEAELARIRGNGARADACFERAITAARTHRSPRREALALELAAAHARATGETAKAEERRLEAVAAYRRWGASAKADVLERATPG
jgi:predicted ATPase